MHPSQLGAYSLLRPGEHMADASITMCDLQSAFHLGGPQPRAPSGESPSFCKIGRTCGWLLLTLQIGHEQLPCLLELDYLVRVALPSKWRVRRWMAGEQIIFWKHLTTNIQTTHERCFLPRAKDPTKLQNMDTSRVLHVPWLVLNLGGLQGD